jgi:hypothetical protein
MTLHAATTRLWETAHQLRDDLFTLRLQAVEDRPRGEPNKLVQDVGAVSENLAGWAEEILDGAGRAVAAADHPLDLAGLRRAVDICAEAIERLGAHLQDGLAETRRLDELTTLARGAGSEQRAWVGAIKQAVDAVQQSLWTVQTALTSCWRELAERAMPVPAAESADTTRRS